MQLWNTFSPELSSRCIMHVAKQWSQGQPPGVCSPLWKELPAHHCLILRVPAHRCFIRMANYRQKDVETASCLQRNAHTFVCVDTYKIWIFFWNSPRIRLLQREDSEMTRLTALLWKHFSRSCFGLFSGQVTLQYSQQMYHSAYDNICHASTPS